MNTEVQIPLSALWGVYIFAYFCTENLCTNHGIQGPSAPGAEQDWEALLQSKPRRGRGGRAK
jgi:hypothetical protein